jgi:glycine/sarcosine N-methyltransferase
MWIALQTMQGWRTTTLDYYGSWAASYDVLHPKEEIFQQREFFERLVEEYGVKSVLDCACGTGWHLYMLREMGLEAFGSDVSEPMLDKGRANLSGLGVDLRPSDYRALSEAWGDQHFDMVICMSTAFPHMRTDQDAVAALRSMYGQLNDGGILVISNGISDALLDSKPKLIPARVQQPGHAFYFVMEYPSPEEVVFDVLHVWTTPAGFEHNLAVIPYNAMRLSSMQRYFKQTAFRQVRYFGDYESSEYLTERGSRLIAVAEK